jgi:hypothetical protein
LQKARLCTTARQVNPFPLFSPAFFLIQSKVLLSEYLNTIGHPCPTYTNPADRAISLVNTDFDESEKSSSSSEGVLSSRLDQLAADWERLALRYSVPLEESPSTSLVKISEVLPVVSTQDSFRKTLILTERNFWNYIRNILAFGIRSKYRSCLPRLSADLYYV